MTDIDPTKPAKAKQEISPLAAAVDPLVAAGYADHLISVMPPGVQYSSRKSNGVATIKVSDGKLPGLFDNSRWRLFLGWRKSQQFLGAANIELLKRWPDAGIGLRLGAVLALDFDLYSVEGEQGKRERRLLDALLAMVAERLNISVAALATRTRRNAPSSVMVFIRALDTGVTKRWTDFRLGEATCKIELLGEGQQGVIAGHHKSGVRVETNLHLHPFHELPGLDRDGIDALWAAMIAAIEEHGGMVVLDSKTSGSTAPEPIDARTAVMRALAVAGRWEPFIPRKSGANGEMRVPPEDLDRGLEEGISFYPDGGIFDHGTRRSHDPISLLREMCIVKADGTLEYSPPDYSEDHVREPLVPAG